MKDADIGEVVFGAVFTIGTLGVICLVPDPPALCSKARTWLRRAPRRRNQFESLPEARTPRGRSVLESTLNVVFTSGDATSSTTLASSCGTPRSACPMPAPLHEADGEPGGGEVRLRQASLCRPRPATTVPILPLALRRGPGGGRLVPAGVGERGRDRQPGPRGPRRCCGGRRHHRAVGGPGPEAPRRHHLSVCGFRWARRPARHRRGAARARAVSSAGSRRPWCPTPRRAPPPMAT